MLYKNNNLKKIIYQLIFHKSLQMIHYFLKKIVS